MIWVVDIEVIRILTYLMTYTLYIPKSNIPDVVFLGIASLAIFIRRQSRKLYCLRVQLNPLLKMTKIIWVS